MKRTNYYKKACEIMTTKSYSSQELLSIIIQNNPAAFCHAYEEFSGEGKKEVLRKESEVISLARSGQKIPANTANTLKQV